MHPVPILPEIVRASLAYALCSQVAVHHPLSDPLTLTCDMHVVTISGASPSGVLWYSMLKMLTLQCR